MKKLLFIATFLIMSVFVSKFAVTYAQYCPPENWCLCGSGDLSSCCAVEGSGGYNCGGGGTGTPPPGGGGVERTCYPRKDCPLNSSCTPSGIYSCNNINANYNSYVDYYIGDVPSGYEGTCPMGNAEETVQVCSDGSCYWYDRKYDCCPAGSISQYYYTQGADYQVYASQCDGTSSQIYNCYPGTFVSTYPTSQCGVSPRDEEGQRYPLYNYTTTCRPAPTKNHVCTPVCTVTSPSTPSLLTPSNGASISSTSVSLTWNNSSQTWGNSCATNNNQYEVYVGLCSGSLALAGTVGSGTNSIQFSGSEGQNYCWKVRAKNGSANTDSATWSFTINSAEPWWQVKDGDVTTNGDIISEVPTAQLFDIIGLGGFAGVPVYGSSFNLSGDTSKISATLWHANTTTIQSRVFNYAFFDNLIPDDVNFNDVSTLVSGGTSYTDGYEWYTASGDVSTSGDINIGNRKVILFVENGNFNINGKINVNDGVGFFGVFVDGNISIDPAVVGAPSIEGIYLSDGSFSTGLGTSQLHVRGSVASFGGVNLQRDLTVDTTPAELFEFAPDQMLLFPEKLMFRRTKWTEVAP